MVSFSGMAMIMAALGLLVLPGIAYNSMNNYGLAPAQVLGTAGVCGTFAAGQPVDPTCQGSVAAGCQVNGAYCTLSGNTVPFLNNCSPFTNILTLNYIGFINSFFSNCGVQGAQSQAGGLGLGNVTIPGMTATFGLHSGTYPSNQRQWVSVLALHPVPQGITTPYYTTCLSWNGTSSSTLFGYETSGHGRYTTGCNFVDSSNPQIGYTMTCWLYTNSTKDVSNAICDNWSGSTTGSLSFGSILSFGLSILGSAILIFIGLGIDFSAGGSLLASGASFGLGSNRQGSKMAQVFGVGLLIWSPLYSEFSPWFTSGILPAGLDGLTGIVSIAIIGLMFFGLYSQATTN